MKLALLLTTILAVGLLGCSGNDPAQVSTHSYSKTSSTQIINQQDEDWSRWRGPNGNGIASSNQTPVTKWDSETNVLWKTEVPGRGHASPTIFGDKIFLATADKTAGTQSVLCFDRLGGKKIWEEVVNNGGLRGRIHSHNSLASSTISTDGERLFAVFENHDTINLYVLDHDGKQLWKKEVGPYEPHFPFGFGASPLIHGDHIVVSGESRKGFMVAYDRQSGDEVWRIDRNRTSSYSSPIVTEIDGREMLLMSGGEQVNAFDPNTGAELWNTAAKWKVTCGTMVWDGNMVFASGGFPAQQTVGVNGTNGEIVWENQVKCYEQSLLAYDGFVYCVNDRGIAYCWQAKDGKEMWKSRLGSGGSISASPILANGNIYVSIEAGTTFVFKANPEKFELVSTNQLGDSTFATLTIVDDKIFLRVASAGQEWLYCVGK